MLGDQQHRAAPFAADGEALDEAQGHQQRRRPVADLPERRQAAHQERRGADEQQAELQQLLAAELVAVVAEHDAAQRAGDEADRVGDEGREDRVELAGGLGEKKILLNTRVAAVP